jgi:hypothetical protein
VTVPGAVAGWVALSERFGKLPFADLLAPAIEIAERGYAVPVEVQQKWARAAAVPELTASPALPRPSCRAAARRRWASVRLPGSGAHAAPDRRHEGRGLLPRRDGRRRWRHMPRRTAAR